MTPSNVANNFGSRLRGYVIVYNARGELVEANETSTANNDRAYQFDGIGNRQKTANGLLGDLPSIANYATTNALNQYTTIPSVSAGLRMRLDPGQRP